jgi:predicted MFS family arabinose efflux permease
MKPVTAKRDRLLYLITFWTDFSGFMLVFTISRSLAESEAPLMTLGLVGGAFSLSYGIGSIFFGTLSDRLGRGRLVLMGQLGTTGCSLVLLLLGSGVGFPHYIAYAVYGLVLGSIYAPIMAWLNQDRKVGEFSRGISSVLIRFCLSWNLGLLMGQVTGGLLFPFGNLVPLMAVLGSNLLCVILVLLVPRQNSESAEVVENKSGMVSPHEQALAKSLTSICWISNLAGTFSVAIIIHLFPQLAVSLGVDPEWHGIALACMRVGTITVYFLLHRTDFWHYRYKTTLVAQIVGMGGLLMLVFADGIWELSLGLFGIAVLTGHNYFVGLFYSTMGRSESQLGFASGMHEGTLALGFTLGAVSGGVAGHLLQYDRVPYILGIVVIAALIIPQLVIYTCKVQRIRHNTLATSGAPRQTSEIETEQSVLPS